MEKQKGDLLRSMQSLLTDFAVKTVDDNRDQSMANNETELSKLQQIFKMKVSDDDSLIKELASLQIISEVDDSCIMQGEGEPLSGDIHDLKSTVECPSGDYQWRFVETCTQSLLLLDQFMTRRDHPSSRCVLDDDKNNTAKPSNKDIASSNGKSDATKPFNHNNFHETGVLQQHHSYRSTDELNRPANKTQQKKSTPRGKLQHQPNYLGAKDLKVVSGVVQLVLTYGVWPRLLQG